MKEEINHNFCSLLPLKGGKKQQRGEKRGLTSWKIEVLCFLYKVSFFIKSFKIIAVAN